MVVWIIVAVVVVALAAFAFWPRKSRAYSGKTIRDMHGQGSPDLYDNPGPSI
jgi:hypothetical protein